VLIGIAVKGKAVAGVVYQPFYKQASGAQEGRAVWAALGLGMFCLFYLNNVSVTVSGWLIM
jgi:3'(2'), 5'-bisphosphate nucleotidase